ncbi:MAG TPA: UrcA family protein [Povalibacter sp.]|nr:UrcA family protein [Povalibacter sp.]
MNAHRRIVKSLLNCCVTAALSCGALAATAGTPLPENSVVVRYDDLNLANPAGIQTLYRRIRTAAKVVCGGSESRSVQAMYLASQCRERAIDDAVGKVNNRILSAMHKEKTARRNV